MGLLSGRLRASVKFDAHNGDSEERGICAKQMLEAADELDRLETLADKMKGLLREVMSWHADKESREYNDCDQEKCLWCEQAQALVDAKETVTWPIIRK
jgi:hypothetical protein